MAIPQPMLAINLIGRQNRLQVKCATLDNLLLGGFPTCMISELCGESGSGKTQICLQLALVTQLPPNKGGVFGSTIYIHINTVFPSVRLNQMLTSLKAKFDDEANNYMSLDNVFVKRVDDCKHFLTTLNTIEQLCEEYSQTSRNVRVIVIDSITSLFQCDFANTANDMRARSNMFFTISAKLRNIANAYNVAVVITNDIRDAFDHTGFTTNNLILTSSNRRVVPALGLAWSNCINNRFFVGKEIKVGETFRFLKTIFSPYLPNSQCTFSITACGVT